MSIDILMAILEVNMAKCSYWSAIYKDKCVIIYIHSFINYRFISKNYSIIRF